MLRQPRGTNHFQFRFHQFGLGVGQTDDGICSTEVLYFEREAFCNRSLRCDLSLTGSVAAMQDVGHETTTLPSNYFRMRFDCAHWRLHDDYTLRSSRACWHVDELARHSLDNQSRRHISRHGYDTKGRDLGQVYGHRRYDYDSRDSSGNGQPKTVQRARSV